MTDRPRSVALLARAPAPGDRWTRSRKLDPRVQVRNPVMFVVEIGAVITTVAWLIQLFGGGRSAAATSRPGSRSRSRSGCG